LRRPARIVAVQLSALAAVGAAVVVPIVSGPDKPGSLAAASAQPAAPRRAVPPRVTEIALPEASARRAASVPARSTASFSLLGVTWPRTTGAEPAVTVMVRVRSAGRWTGWQRLAVDHEHTPDRVEGAQGRDGTEPLWVGAADGVQAIVTASAGTTLRGAKVSLVDPGTSGQDSPTELDSRATTSGVSAAAVSPAPYPQPAIITRRAWGADESLRDYNPDCSVPSYTSTIRAGFVHHTAGSNTYSAAESAGLVRAMYAFHVKSRGWCDLGYNFLVDRYGRVFEGRYGGVHVPVLGAHTGGYNTNSFGVSLMGEFTSTEPTAEIMESTARVLAWKLDGHYRNPRGTTVLGDKTFNVIAGHRDATATECPGARVYARLPWLRTRVLTLMGGGYGTEIYDYSRQLGGEIAVGGSWWLEHAYAGGRATWFTHRDIYWSPATGARSVTGPIRTLHRQLGTVLGFPRLEEQAAAVSGARVQYFLSAGGAGRAVYWSTGTGAHEVLDSIYIKYRAVGAERSVLGLPGTGQRVAHVAGGYWNGFQRGRIYTGPNSGTHMIHNAINLRFGDPAAYRQLGLPTADQTRARIDGAWVQAFQSGRIYWSSATGAWEVWGPIKTAYDGAGAETSALRLPKTKPYDVTEGRAQDFEGGKITWNATTGASTITYN